MKVELGHDQASIANWSLNQRSNQPRKSTGGG